ncbi:trichohyalin [Nematostella vectensis]|uniref:trichohyalin n=1 Tax=Nematostella vectensis TaxID=45351 RepID=UPI00207753C4|nr:trichohyalin [Nematostella vectensis]
MEEDDDSWAENMEEATDLSSLKLQTEGLLNKIERKQEHLVEFLTSINKENEVNRKSLNQLEEVKSCFKDGKKSKAEVRVLYERIKERFQDIQDKQERIEICLEVIDEKKEKLVDLKNEVAKHAEENNEEELDRLIEDVKSCFDHIMAKFRECKKLKISLSKSKLEEISQSAKCWEKAAEVAKELTKELKVLREQLEEKESIIDSTEGELEDEKEKCKEAEENVEQLMHKFDKEEKSKEEQAFLINSIRGLLDESEKLVRNLEAQNKNLTETITEERTRVNELRGKVSLLQERVEQEKKNNRSLEFQMEQLKTKFSEARSLNEGYERDMRMIREELLAIREIRDVPAKRKKFRKQQAEQAEAESSSSESSEDLEEKMKMKDKLLEDKYIENQRLEAEVWKSAERIKVLEEEILWRAEKINALISDLQKKENSLEEMTELLKDTQTRLQSEKLVKNEYIIKCEILEGKLAMLEKDDDRDSAQQEEKDGLLREIEKLTMMLQEERDKSEESSALVEDLEEQLAAETQYSDIIRSKSIENIAMAERENKQLMTIVEDLRQSLAEKDIGIEDLIMRCAVEELKLREEIASLSSHVQIRKRDSIFKARVIQRLRKEVVALKRGLGPVSEDEEDDNETDELEKLLQEERVRAEKYEDALTALNKQYEETENQIREKDLELSRKSAEDGQRIAELLQELDFNKTAFEGYETQIRRLEEIMFLQERIEMKESEEMEGELEKKKDEYATETLKRKDDIIQELKQKVETLSTELATEKESQKRKEALIGDLNEANNHDLKEIKELHREIVRLEDQIHELTEKVEEGQKLIAEVEGIADRERMRTLALEELLAIDKKGSTGHLETMEELKRKVETYQANVGELKRKVDRMRIELHRRPQGDDDDEEGISSKQRYGPIRRLHEKLSSQKTTIQDLKANMNEVERRNEKLDEQLQKQKDRNDEQDEKINLLFAKSLECEDVIGRMMEKLELMRERYIGLSGMSEEDLPEENNGKEGVLARETIFRQPENIPGKRPTPVQEDRSLKEREDADEEVIVPEIRAAMPLTVAYSDLMSSETGSDSSSAEIGAKQSEEERQESDASVYFESRGKSQTEIRAEVQESINQIPYDPMLIEHLIMFEQVFENIFTEEGRRITMVLEKFQGIIDKNAEFFVILQDLKKNLNETREANEMKTSRIRELEDRIEKMKRKGTEDSEKFMKEVSEKEKKLIAMEDKLQECNKTIEELSANVRSSQETIESLSQMLRQEKNKFSFKEALVNELEQRLEQERKVTEQISKALEEEEERTLQLSEVLTAEQVKGVHMQDSTSQVQNKLHEHEERNRELSDRLEEEMNLVNQLKESLAVEQMVKIEYQEELEKLKGQLMEEREVAERLREELGYDKNSRYEAEGKLSQLEEELYAKHKAIEEMQEELETERKCYRIMSERLEAEHSTLRELEEKARRTEEVAVKEKIIVEELSTALNAEQENKQIFATKLEKIEQETKYKDEEIGSLVSQLGDEKNKIENLLADIDVERMAKSKVEAKLKELEEHINRDEQLFEELRENIDSESGRNRELSELLDKERMKNEDLEEKLKELEKQVLSDVQLFDELRVTIERERENNRELSELLKSGGEFNNRDSLLAELDVMVTELKDDLEKERRSNRQIRDEMRKIQDESAATESLQEILNSQIIHTSELKDKLESESERRARLEEYNREYENKVGHLQRALSKVRELSAKVTRELEEDSDYLDEVTDYSSDDSNDSTRRELRKINKAVAKKKGSQKQLKTEVEEYRKQLQHKESEMSQISKAAEEKVAAEIEKINMMVRESELRSSKTIEELRFEMAKRNTQMQEIEEERETLKKFYEEEKNFAREKLEATKRLSEKVSEFESLAHHKEEEINSLKEFKTKSEKAQQELHEKSERLRVTEEDVSNLQRAIQELSLHKDSKESLIQQLMKKEQEIERLTTKCKDLEKEDKENEKCIFKLQAEIMRLRPLEKSTKKYEAAIKKSKLLFEAMQTDVHIKNLQMAQLRQEVTELKSQVLQTKATLKLEDQPSNSDDTGKKNDDNRDNNGVKDPAVIGNVTGETSNGIITTDGACEARRVADYVDAAPSRENKNEQIARLKDRVIHMATVMQKVREEHRIAMTEKENEILNIKQAFAVMKKLFNGLQAELKKSEFMSKTMSENISDATLVIEEFGTQVDILRKDVENKTEMLKGLKERIVEMKKSNDAIDKRKLKANENVKKLLTAEVEEKKRRLQRYERLQSSLNEAYKEASKSSVDGTRDESRNEEITQTSCNETSGKTPIKEEVINATEHNTLMAASPTDDIFEQELQEIIYKKHVDISKNEFRMLQGTVELPPTEWKVRLVFYVVAGCLLSLVSYHVDPKHLPLVFGLLGTPVLFALTTFEISRYRKNARESLKRIGLVNAKDEFSPEAKVVIEQLRLQIESDKEVIEDLKQELEGTQPLPSGEDEETDEVDVLEEQRHRISSLEGHLKLVEKARLEDDDRNNINFEEYKRLRNELEILKKKRAQEELQEAMMMKRKNQAEGCLDKDIKWINLGIASLPLWAALAIALMQVTTTHPFAPFSVLLLLVITCANVWYGKKVVMKKLIEERKIVEEQNEELDDLTELLEKEHDVVQAQKEAIDTMVREIDNEHVSLKEKRMTLAKMIWQVKEMEEMRAAIIDTDSSQLNDEVIKTSMKALAQEIAVELPDDDSVVAENLLQLASTSATPNVMQGQVAVSPKHKKLKAIADMVISILALVVSIVYKSGVVSGLIALQLFLQFVYRKAEESSSKVSENLQKKLEFERKRCKTYKEQAVKLKKLYEAEKNTKTTDEFAKVVQDRQQRRKKTVNE